jgi:beta-1,4-mannosyltransferase
VAPVLAENPYQQLLERELERLGARFEHPPALTARWALRTRAAVLHLHWLEYVTGSHAVERLHSARVALRTARLLTVLGVLRARRVRLVWTVHNLRPHEGTYRRFDLAIARIVARRADAVIVHSRHAAALVRRAYGVREVTVAHHGGYEGRYPVDGLDRAEVRRRLGLPAEAHVVLAFGLVRRYKRLPELIAAVRSLPDPDLCLVVAGRAVPAQLEAAVRDAAADDPRIVLRLGHVPDAQVAELHAAADVAAIAYGDVFSSGALMLALSLGVPVVAPADSTADELARPPAVQAYHEGGLAAALARSRAVEPATARQAALEAAARYPWSAAAATIMASYRAEEA